MANIDSVFSRLKAQNKAAFIPFITAGDGGLSTTLDLLQNLVVAGADIIELGVPFSDPMADGEVIQRANERALAKDISLKDVLNIVAQFRVHNTKTPIILMGYANPIEYFGYQAFAKNAAKAGVNGVLIVDMPPEESQKIKQYLDDYKINLIFLVSPTTTNKRLKLLSRQISGFAYFVALKGVTGAKNFDFDLVAKHLKRLRQYIKVPIAVGFGVNNAKTAKALAQIADAVVMGSHLVAIIEKYQHDKQRMFAKINQEAKQIAKATKIKELV